MAPEHFMAEECSPDYVNIKEIKRKLASLDIWSLGVTLYTFIYQKLPFYDEKQTVLLQKI